MKDDSNFNLNTKPKFLSAGTKFPSLSFSVATVGSFFSHNRRPSNASKTLPFQTLTQLHMWESTSLSWRIQVNSHQKPKTITDPAPSAPLHIALTQNSRSSYAQQIQRVTISSSCESTRLSTEFEKSWAADFYIYTHDACQASNSPRLSVQEGSKQATWQAGHMLLRFNTRLKTRRINTRWGCKRYAMKRSLAS